ncbi:MAG TPA: glycosyltransferase [Patescibacteria group bacterium]|nr:glycosyltransferase [Patescibacteria group bacterium]
MKLVLAVLAAGIVLDVALFLPLPVRKVFASVTVLVNGFAAGLVAVGSDSLFGWLLGLAMLFRIFNAIRIVQGRMHERYLRITTRRTTLSLIGLQLVIALVWTGWHYHRLDSQLLWATLAALQLIAAIVLLASTVRRLKRTAWPLKRVHYSDAQLPTVSVAIPARNETEDLEACLRSLVASNYPKLEILVLDDCSQTKRTPEIIRDFAHDGVRFINGDPPEGAWLAKNQAYERLAQEASGDYILFCGVDIRFEPQTIHDMLCVMLSRHKKMLCVVPERAPAARARAALAQSMRYFWELAPPRRLFHRPPVLSSCWIIQKQALKKAGGFAAVTRAIVPEAHFARELAQKGAYSFLRAGLNPGLSSTKSADEQRATAVRTRYPQLHRRPENVLLVTLWEFTFLVLPFVLALIGAWLGIGVVAVVLAALATVLLVACYELLALSTHINTWWFALIGLPVVAVYDIALAGYSMWQYEFDEVEWKGRNVCVPTMHVIPRLPPLHNVR